MFPIIRSGYWYLSSKTDPRWNCSGTASSLCFSAGMPPEAQKALEEKKKELGDPPADLEWGGMKD